MRNKVSELRAEYGMSQAALAETVGVSRQTINGIERERYDPSIDLAFRLANVFDCLIEDLFFPGDS